MALGVLLAWSMAVGTASADELAACPDDPAAYAGTDELVGELRALRIEQRASCVAIAARLDRAHDDLAALDGKVSAVKGATDDVAAAVGAVKGAVEAIGSTPETAVHVQMPEGGEPPAGTEDAPTHVVLASASSKQLDDGLSAINGTMWVLLGFGAATFFGGWAIRVWRL